jgi:archaeosine synthase beta-subunit
MTSLLSLNRRAKALGRLEHGCIGDGLAEIRPGLADGLHIDRLCIVLASNGCDWYRQSGGCLMCNFPHKVPVRAMSRESLAESLLSSLERQLAAFPPRQPTICIYNSGSFFSDEEIPPHTRVDILRIVAARPGVRQIVVESRCNHIDAEKLDSALAALEGQVRLSVGMGLESTSDVVRNRILLKGTSLNTFEHAARLLKGRAGLIVYTLLGTPFLSECERLIDAKKTIVYAQALGTEELWVQACNVQPYSAIESLWEAGQFRTPWLWTLRSALEYASDLGGWQVFAAGREGTPRPREVAHNCEYCTTAAWATIEKFNETQDKDCLVFPHCQCQRAWEEEMDKVPVLSVEERINRAMDMFS